MADESVNNNEDDAWERRRKEYQDFFGDAWVDFFDHYLCENKSPQEVVDTYWDEIDYCKWCCQYYWIKSEHGIYYCPYCHTLGEGSEHDYAAEREARAEHDWEVSMGK